MPHSIPFHIQQQNKALLNDKVKEIQSLKTELEALRVENLAFKQKLQSMELSQNKLHSLIQSLKVSLAAMKKPDESEGTHLASSVISQYQSMIQFDNSKHLSQFIQENHRDLYLFEDVYKGHQEYNLQLMDAASSSQVPLNQFANSNHEQKLRLLQERALHKMIALTQKLHHSNKLSSGHSIQIMEKGKY